MGKRWDGCFMGEKMARSARFERATTAFGGRYSIQLSYERATETAFYGVIRLLSSEAHGLSSATSTKLSSSLFYFLYCNADTLECSID